MQLYILIVLVGWFTACSHTTPQEPSDGAWLRKGTFIQKDGKPDEMDDRLDFVELQKYKDYTEVKKWIEYFTHNGRRSFAGYIERGQVYRPLIESILEQSELPKSLYYLAMIESGFVIRAASNKQAVGIWQFIPGSAERFGLQINAHVDERLDPIRATWAATRYLKDLHNVFQSWFLAFSAYDTGERRILSAIMRKGTRNYWQLTRGSAFVDETQNYVPKFLAAAIIGENLAEYGFEVKSRPAYPQLQAVLFPAAIALRHIAEESGLSVEQLKTINPQLLSPTLPHFQEGYRLWLPISTNVDMDRIEALHQQERKIVSTFRAKTKASALARLSTPKAARGRNPLHRSHHRKNHLMQVAVKKKRNHKKTLPQRAYAEY
jgi:membrane-bound lytic murein transglycosylase D